MPIPAKHQLENGKWIKDLDFNDWRKMYHNTFFSNEQTRLVFNDLLRELGYYNVIHNENDRLLYNFAKKLISWCGEFSIDVKPPVDVVIDGFGNPALMANPKLTENENALLKRIK
jgi:capsule polysaccharide export protein KpsC/LpsZ